MTPDLASDEFIAELQQVLSEITEPHTEVGFSAKQVAGILERLANAERQVKELQAQLVFADEQARKLEALLEPHISWDDKPSALEDALSATPGDGEVVVKPLEWREYSGTWTAPTPFGIYRIYHYPEDGRYKWFIEGVFGSGATTSNCEAAKAAAQSDYEARIMSALAPRATVAGEPGIIKTESMGEFLLVAFLSYLSGGRSVNIAASLAMDKYEKANEPDEPPLPAIPLEESQP